MSNSVEAVVRALLVLGLLWLTTWGAVAGEGRLSDLSAPNFENFGVNDGLSDEVFSTIGMDGQGFIWAGSASGLHRFDGYRWQSRPIPGASSLVRDMLTDPEGHLWAIFEREGLAVNRGGEWKLTGDQAFYHRFNSGTGSTGREALWLSQPNRVFQLDDGQWRSQPDWVPPGHERITSVAVTEDLLGGPRLWVARSPGQVWSRDLNDSEASWEALEIDVSGGTPVTDLVVSRSNGLEELWILTYGSGIIRLRSDGSRQRWRKYQGPLPSESIYSGVVTYDEADNRSLWIASRGGLLRFRGEDFTVFDRSDGLASNAVRGIKRLSTPSGQDILWLATEGGVTRMRLTPTAWRTVSRLGASENGIFGVFAKQDANGNDLVVVGSGLAGLAVYKDGEWTQLNRSNGGMPSDRIRGVWPIDRDGDLGLVSMEGGRLYILTEELALVEVDVEWPLARTQGATDVVEAFGQIWIGAFDSAIWRLDGRRLEPIHAPILQEGLLMALDVQTGPQGAQWVWGATSEGLVRITETRYDRIAASPAQEGFRYRDVEVIQEGADQVLWASTERHGVVRYAISNPSSPIRLDDSNRPPVPDPTVYSVRADTRGRIYICTNNGVQQLIPTADGYAGRVFRKRDGLAHDECNSRSQFIDAQDRYWVGTLAGLSVYDPTTFDELVRQPRAASPLRLTHVELDGRRQSADSLKRLEVPEGTDTFAVHATLLTQRDETRNEYRFILNEDGRSASNFETAWSRQPFRIWSAAEPGSYSLRIEARDFAGIPAQALELPVLIKARWFERPAAQLFLVVGAAFLLFGLGAFYTRQLRQRKERLEELVDQRTEDLARANRQLTQLSFLDPLTSAANRRRLDRAGRDELKRAARLGQPLSLVLLDLDHFKRFNDRHGHLAGDQALKEVVRILEGTMRSADLIARFGGEEFACLLPDTDAEQAAEIAERARIAVMAESGQALGDRYAAVTISAGVATSRPGETELKGLIDRADRALYQAKREGRNRVVSTNGKETDSVCV